ncbi:MAG: hypothetical protein GWO24_06600 [Akkermansiaceae bacterium]|nr:hypothetical protein [Akkermansiaceae bacterium]
MATSLSAWVNVILLWRGLGGFVRVPREDRRRLSRIVMASLVMGVLVWLGARGLESWFAGVWWLRMVALLLVVGLGVVAYAFLAIRLKAATIAELKAGLGKE